MFYGTKTDAVAMLQERYGNDEIIAFQIWTPEDVQAAVEGRAVAPLSDEDAAQVLKVVAEGHDCYYGVNWETLQCVAEDMFDGSEV